MEKIIALRCLLQTFSSALARSSIKSLESSIPTEYLIKLSGIPIAARSSGVHSTWLVVAGGPAIVSTDPMFAAKWIIAHK